MLASDAARSSRKFPDAALRISRVGIRTLSLLTGSQDIFLCYPPPEPIQASPIAREHATGDLKKRSASGRGAVRVKQIKRNWRKAAVRGLAQLLVAACVALGALPSHAPAAQERYDYDALGRLIRVIDEQGRVTQYVYDAAGNILQVITGGTAQAPTVTSIAPG